MKDIIRKPSDESVFTSVLLQRVQEVPAEYLSRSEHVLRKMANPTLKLYEIKRSFWKEMTRIEGTGGKFVASNVYDKIMSKNGFYDKLLRDPKKLAWVLSPMVKYELKTKAILDRLTDRYDDLVNMEITTVRRKKNADNEWEEYEETCPKKALVLLQVIKNVEERVKGLSVQKQITIKATEPADQKASLDMDTVNEKLKDLEEKLGSVDTTIEI